MKKKNHRQSKKPPSLRLRGLIKFKKWVKYANEMTDDVTHSTQYYIEYMNRAIYLGQFTMQNVETWQANSSTGNTPMAIKILFPWQLTSFQSPPTWFQYVSDFQLAKCLTGPQTRANIFICLPDHAYEVLLANIKMECQWCQERLLIWGRSGTQYVAMAVELLSSYCGAHLVELHCKESNNSDTNWLRYLSSSYLKKIWLSVWHHHLATLHILKPWISLEQKEIFEKSKRHFPSHGVYLFMFENGLDWKDVNQFIKLPQT